MAFQIQPNETTLSVKDQFLKDLDKNIKLDSFKITESELRSKLRKEVEKGTLF